MVDGRKGILADLECSYGGFCVLIVFGPTYDLGRSAIVRILHIISSVDPASGGPIEGIIQQNLAMLALGGEREIASLDLPNSLHLKHFPIKVYPLGTRPKNVHGRNGLLTHYRHSSKLIPWLRENVSKYDCVIVNGVWNYSTFAASRILPFQQVPYFVFTHGMLDPWFRKQYPVKHWVKQLFWFFCEGPLLANAKAVLFTTEEERRLARGEFWGCRYREQVVGYGISGPPPSSPNQKATFLLKVPGLGARRYLLFLSRIHLKKGCDNLIRAFSKVANIYPDIDLVVAGPDQTGMRAKLEKEAKRLGVGHRVHWPGLLSGDAKWGAFREAEAFILPSHQENFGIVVAEALACSVPVLISNKVNIWREVEKSGGGFVEDDDLKGTERLLTRFFTLSSNQRHAMAESARACFERNFDVNATVTALYEQLVKATVSRS